MLCAGVVDWGYGHHKADLPVSIRISPTPLKVSSCTRPILIFCRALTVHQLLWLNQVFFKLTTMCFKLSLCLAYWKLFSRFNSPGFRLTTYAVCALTFSIVGYYGAAFFASIFQCTPIDKSWMTKYDGHCIDLNKFRFYTAAANIITSVFVIALPLPALFAIRLELEVPEMNLIIVLILLGLL